MLHIHSLTFNPLQENTYIICNAKTNNGILIDPGCYDDYENNILKNYLHQEKINIIHIMLTHAHLDHVFGLKYWCNQLGLKPYLHEKEKIILDVAEKSAQKWNCKMDAYKGDVIYIKENDVFYLDDEPLHILFTPGHSPGSICLYYKNNFAVVGDVIFKNSIGRTDLMLANFDILMQSIQQHILTLPDNIILYPGHGNNTTVKNEKMSNPFLKL